MNTTERTLTDLCRRAHTLRQIYRTEYCSQSRFGPRHGAIFGENLSRLSSDERAGPISYVFRRSLEAKGRWLHTFTNGDGAFAFRRSGELVIDWLVIRSNDAISDAAAAIEGARSRGREGQATAPLHVWLEISPNDDRQRALVDQLKAVRVGTRHTAEADVFGVYFLDSPDRPRVATVVSVDPLESLMAARLTHTIPEPLLAAIERELTAITLAPSRHYSKKNVRGSWTALSLHGFSDDPNEIAKPTEVKSSVVNPPVRPTRLLEERPRLKELIDELIGYVPSASVERVRVMQLAGAAVSRTSEVKRHSDLTDREHGVSENRIVRIHIPLVTHRLATISVWDDDDREHVHHFERGAFYYLDVRRPHRVVNRSTRARVHLVVDYRVDQALRDTLTRATAL
jgi:hypothetical protein